METLLLNGSADPATPVQFAESLKKTLGDKGEIVIFPSFGHNVFNLPCARKIVRNFLAKGLAELDQTCVKNSFVPKLFDSGLGPK